MRHILIGGMPRFSLNGNICTLVNSLHRFFGSFSSHASFIAGVDARVKFHFREILYKGNQHLGSQF